MIKLVSLEYSFPHFCEQMIGENVIDVLSSASAEITYARTNHQEKTKDKDFRKGSRGQIYCDDLQHFVRAFIDGAAPNDASQRFLNAAKPLALDIVKGANVFGMRDIVRRACNVVKVGSQTVS